MDKTLVALSKKYGLPPTRKASPSSTTLANSLPSLRLLEPTFPTFSALATVSDVKPAEGRKGLFLALVGDPQVLLQDLLDSPAKYEEGVSTLLQDLASGRRKLGSLTPAEAELLDRATIDYTRRSPRQEVEPPPRRAPVQQADDESEEGEGHSMRYPSPQVPELNGLEPYWWLG